MKPIRLFVACTALVGFAAITAAGQEQPRRGAPGNDFGKRPDEAREPRSAPPGDGDPRGQPGPMPPRGRGDRPPEGFPGRPPQDGPPGRGPGPEGRPPSPLGMRGMGFERQRLEEDDPEMYALLVEDSKLERQTVELAERFRRATAEERDGLKAELHSIVVKHFETRQKRRELQLKRMEEEIKRLRDAITTRNDSRDKIVVDRIEQLVGEVDPLDF